MFKVKMSLLLKSAKFKVAIIALVLAAILAGIVFIPANKAVNMSGQVKVKAIKSGTTANGKDYYIIRKTDKHADARTHRDTLRYLQGDAWMCSDTHTATHPHSHRHVRVHTQTHTQSPHRHVRVHTDTHTESTQACLCTHTHTQSPGV